MHGRWGSCKLAELHQVSAGCRLQPRLLPVLRSSQPALVPAMPELQACRAERWLVNRGPCWQLPALHRGEADKLCADERLTAAWDTVQPPLKTGPAETAHLFV